MKSQRWIVAGFFWVAASVASMTVLEVSMAIVGLLAATFCAAKSLAELQIENHYRSLKREMGAMQERESLRLASGKSEGSEWDANGEPWKKGKNNQ